MPNPSEQEPLTASQITASRNDLTFKEKLRQPNFWFTWIVRFCVFAVTGSVSVRITSLLVHKVLGIDGAFKTAPWLPYRIIFILCTLPVYTILIVTIGTLAGQRLYFSHLAIHMWSWCLPGFWRRRHRDQFVGYEPLSEGTQETPAQHV